MEALSQIGPAASRAVPKLAMLLRSKTDNYRAVEAIGAIGPGAKEAVPSLLEVLDANDSAWQSRVVSTFGAIGPEARAAVPVLITRIKNQQKSAINYAVFGKIGPGAKEAVPLLLEALERPNGGQKLDIAVSLGKIGPDAKAALPALIALARGTNSSVRGLSELATEAVLRIAPDTNLREEMLFLKEKVRLGSVPKPKLPRWPIQPESEKKRIKELIDQLVDTRNAGIGYSGGMRGWAFTPLTEHARMETFLVGGEEVSRSAPLRSLVELGPMALPDLLSSLEDDRPTKLQIEHQLVRGGFSFGTGLQVNPLNPNEHDLEKRAKAPRADYEIHDLTYTVKVADLCYVAVGQIVGRQYSAVRYQPTAMIVLESPAADVALRKAVRLNWASADPRRKLFDSLLLDYAAEGVFEGKAPDQLYRASRFQTEAAVRLLYYFPTETASLIAERLNRFDVSDPGTEQAKVLQRDIANGVNTEKFVNALTWCNDERIRKAIIGIQQRTIDPKLKDLIKESKH